RVEMLTAVDFPNLPALRKPHPSWPFQADASGHIRAWEDLDLLKQYARITGSIPLSLDYYQADQLAMVEAIGAPVCITSSPWRADQPSDFWHLLGRVIAPAQALPAAIKTLVK